MNRLVESSLKRLELSVDQLLGSLQEARALAAAHADEKERAARETWNAERRMSILEENVEQMAELQEENRRLREKHAEAMEHATRLLAHVRELQGKFTP